jgi:hypothetical protein
MRDEPRFSDSIGKHRKRWRRDRTNMSSAARLSIARRCIYPTARGSALWRNLSDANRSVGRVTLTGHPLTRSFVRHEEILRGGELHFTVTGKPNTDWETRPADRPYSMSPYRQSPQAACGGVASGSRQSARRVGVVQVLSGWRDLGGACRNATSWARVSDLLPRDGRSLMWLWRR